MRVVIAALVLLVAGPALAQEPPETAAELADRAARLEREASEMAERNTLSRLHGLALAISITEQTQRCPDLGTRREGFLVLHDVWQNVVTAIDGDESRRAFFLNELVTERRAYSRARPTKQQCTRLLLGLPEIRRVAAGFGRPPEQ